MAHMLAELGPSGRRPILRQEVDDPTVKLKAGCSQVRRYSTEPSIDQQFKSFLGQSLIEHNIRLSIDSKVGPVKLTHIVCTIGPASREVIHRDLTAKR